MWSNIRAIFERVEATASTPVTFAALDHCHALVLSGLFDLVGDIDELRACIQFNRRALAARTRVRFPNDWASSQNNLGYALARLGFSVSN
jgi:hypothetical protein